MNRNFYIPKELWVKNIIDSIWQIEHCPTFRKEIIIPKGIVEVIFNFSGISPIPAQLSGRQYHLSNCFINGFNKAPIRIELPGQQVFFGILFQPLAVRKIFKTPAREFSDTTVDVTLLDSTFHSLWHQLAEQDNFKSRVFVFLQWLKINFTDCEPREQMINSFLYASNQHDVSVSALANSLCYSPRQLSRKLFEATGMNTE